MLFSFKGRNDDGIFEVAESIDEEPANYTIPLTL
jgi:hypothetical protein